MDNGDNAFEFWQKLIESMKFSYAQRGWLGDPSYVSKDNITRVRNILESQSKNK